MRRFGLIGYPLSHSFSKTYFADKFNREGIADAVYENFPIADIMELQEIFRNHPDLEGLNVTIPYKEAVIPFLHAKDPVVTAVGACNCLKRTAPGQYTGYNTDTTGFQRSLGEYLQPYHKKAFVLGTGGAAKAVEYVLDLLGIGYTLVSRSPGPNRIAYAQITEEMMNDTLLVINTTPVGMYPNTGQAPDIPFEFLGSRHYLFDLVYNPEKTLFLQKGEKRGATIKNGWDMLVIQAEESWRIWNEEQV
jgi:shikimate dehydrogenase